MNKDINKTLSALVPILRMNGEKIRSIEAVRNWYRAGGDEEYMKEVAEISYDNGTLRYVDIGCDSNLAAVYDVIAVVLQIKQRSSCIERIERGVYDQYLSEVEQFKRQAQLALIDLPAELDAEAVQRCIETIHNLPTPDLKPVMRGRWIQNPNLTENECSECGYSFSHEGYIHYFNYCPCCGAYMGR